MYQLPELPYKYNALEPVISEKIMHLHHDKHHAGYVAKVNAALENTKWKDQSIEEVLKNLDTLPSNIQTPVRNNGGGHQNHTLFWHMMRAPHDNNKPGDQVLTIITKTFGSYDGFKKRFSETAKGQFGSGWAWLVKKSSGLLEIYSTANQDSPYSKNDIPILGIDVWEHAYYLDYVNDRPAYIEKWWQVVNWDYVESLLNS